MILEKNLTDCGNVERGKSMVETVGEIRRLRRLPHYIAFLAFKTKRQKNQS